MEQLKITYITHASIKISGKFGVLITDPWILNEPIYAFTTWKFPAAIIPPEEVVKDVDYIYLTHPHEDHLHIPSIDHFPRHVTILLPEYVDFASLRAQTVERTFRELGFYNIRKIKPWQTYMLGGNTPLTVIPSCKTKYWDWENSGFVLDHDGCKILNMNDCPSDAELYAEVDRRFGEIDLGFVQYSGVSMFPGRFRMSEEELKIASTRRKHSWIQQRNMIELLKVKKIAPFAGDFAWLDDKLYHCNWSNRATPKLFEDFVKDNYPEKNIDVVIMYPSDTWTVEQGLKRNHPEINWNNYLDEIARVKKVLQPKVTAVRQWIEDSNLENLKERSIIFTNHINKFITTDHIDFNATARVTIEGDSANFSFVMRAKAGEKFVFDWNYSENTDHSLFIPQELWAAVLEGKVLLTNIQWAAEGLEHVPFRIEIARFWFWFENHVDLNNRNVQALIDRALHPELSERIRPQLGVFKLENEWQNIQPHESSHADQAEVDTITE